MTFARDSDFWRDIHNDGQARERILILEGQRSMFDSPPSPPSVIRPTSAPLVRPALLTVLPSPAPARSILSPVAIPAQPAPARFLREVVGAVDNVAADRQARLDGEAIKAGFAPPKPWFALGTTLAASGERNYQRSRKDWEKMASIPHAAKMLAQTVENENRRDIDCRASDVTMLDDGRLVVGPDYLAVEQDAVQPLIQRLGIPYGAAYLSACDPELRAHNVNAWTAKDEAADKKIKLRTRNGAQPRSVFAAVGPQYAAADLDTIAEIAGRILPGEAKGEVTYDGRKGSLTALWHAPIDFPTTVGDYYKAGVRVKSGDTGQDSISVSAVLFRAVCRNLTTVSAEVELFRRVHRGNIMQGLEEQMASAAAQALAKLGAFRDSWIGADLAIIQGTCIGAIDLEPAIVRLVEREIIPAVVDPEELVRQIRSAFWKEPQPTVKGIADAVTRAAHEGSWRSPWVTEQLQDAGGSIIRGHETILRLADDAMQEARGGGWTPGRWSLEQIQNGILNHAPVFQFVTVAA